MTICAWNRECLLGEIIDGQVKLNEYGQSVADCWNKIPAHFPHVELDVFVVMPNHFHGIILLGDRRGKACLAPTLKHGGNSKGMACHVPTKEFGKPVAGSLSTIIGGFKSAATKQINIIRNISGAPVWQRNYYEHVIRDEDELRRIREYIVTNPLQWQDDENNPVNIKTK